MDPIQEYVSSVMKHAKLADLPDDLRSGIQDQLTVLAYRRIGVLVVTELGEKNSGEFMQLIERNPAEMDHVAINEFLTKHIDRFDVKLQEALGSLAADFIQKLHGAVR
ncbi:MAG TPA: hypothetical protein DEG44_03360 [Candidatus Kerfeldbacteria bacterium]|nr:hypothetical protein [Candidatus Kerfeldbacteria bacterium]